MNPSSMNPVLHQVLLALVAVLASGSGAASQSLVTAQTTAKAKAELLQACYNKDYNGTASYFEDFLRGFNTSMYLHKAFVSEKQTQLLMTIFVGATPERLSALEAQCRSYPGPVSAAIYVPLIQNQRGPALTQPNAELLQQVASQLEQLFQRMESPAASTSSSDPNSSSSSGPRSPSPSASATCALTAMLLYEVVADPPLAGLLPINALRNAALLPASTPLVAMVDVDLAPSDGLVERVLAGSRLAEVSQLCERQSVVVLPAWETNSRLSMEDGTRMADQALHGDKATLRRLDADSRLHYFAKMAYARGHAATDFDRWLVSDVPYTVSYEDNYEPWFIVNRRLSPPYDVRFRGYGWNKVQQVALVALQNFTFWVEPNAWLVHRPHEKSRGQALYDATGRRGAQQQQQQEEEVRVWQGSRASLSRLFHRRVSALRHVSIRDMRRGTYHPAVDPQTRRCWRELPWWQD